MFIDWYKEKGELRSGMIFNDYEGDLVRLDRTVPGDATKWYVDTWSDYGNCWLSEDNTIEPSDLRGGPFNER